MKKLLASVLLCLSFSSVAIAQTSIRVEGSAIFDKSKVNLTDATPGQIISQLDLSNSSGFRVGAALEFKFLKFFYISPGLTYNQYTNNFTAKNLLSGEKIKFKSHNLMLPVNLGLRFKPLGLIGASVEAGPYAAYELSNEVAVGGKNVVGGVLEELKAFDSKKLSYGLNASAAIEFSAFYVRGGVLYPLTDRGTNVFKVIDEATKAITEIRNNGIKSKELTYFIGLGLRF